MLPDKLGEFLDATALNTGGAGTYLLGDVIDLGSASKTTVYPGGGQTVYLVIQVTTAITTTNGTVRFVLASDDTASIATDGSATVHAQTADLPATAAGTQIVLALPPGAYERYLGILQVTTTAAMAGNINAFLTCDVQTAGANKP